MRSIDPLLMILRKRHVYLSRRVETSKVMYFATEQTGHFWSWVDAALELIALKEYAGKYKQVAAVDSDPAFRREIKMLI